jgi:dCMP deaminase
MRISWEEYALDLARAASNRSEDPYRQVGACALSQDNMVLGLGYNGLAAGKEAPVSFWEDRDDRRKYMIHAEANCVSLFSKGQCRLMAVTLLPCSYCATTIAAYGIKKVVYGEMYDFDEKALEIFDFYNVELIRLDD